MSVLDKMTDKDVGAMADRIKDLESALCEIQDQLPGNTPVSHLKAKIATIAQDAMLRSKEKKTSEPSPIKSISVDEKYDLLFDAVKEVVPALKAAVGVTFHDEESVFLWSVSSIFESFRVGLTLGMARRLLGAFIKCSEVVNV